MIFFGKKEVTRVYLGDRPLAYITIDNNVIWRSIVRLEGAVAIAMTSEALMNIADGVEYKINDIVAGVSCSSASTSNACDYNGDSVFAPLVLAKPYMRHIAPTQSLSPYVHIASGMPVIAPSKRDEIADILGAVQEAAIVSGHGADTSEQHPVAWSQSSDAIGGMGEVTRYTSVAGGVHNADVLGGSGNLLRNMEISGGVQNADAIGGMGGMLGQSHTAAGVYRVKPLIGAGEPKGASAVTVGVYDSSGSLSDGRLYAAWASVGAVSESKPMNAGTDRFSVIANSSGLLPDLEAGYVGILPSSCDYQTPTATAELLRSYPGITPAACDYQTPTAVAELLGRYVGILPVYCDYQMPTAEAEVLWAPVGCRDGKTAESALHSCAEVAPVCAAGAPGEDAVAGGAVCAVSMITRAYINPVEIAFDDALVTEMDILALAEIDQMRIQN